jgi:hypothetical protein
MAIRNPDGSAYKPVGTLAQFDPESKEHDLFNVWDQEAIEIGGTPLYYHEVFINFGQNIPFVFMDSTIPSHPKT